MQVKIYEHVPEHQNVRNKTRQSSDSVSLEIISIIFKIYAMDQVKKQGMKQYK